MIATGFILFWLLVCKEMTNSWKRLAGNSLREYFIELELLSFHKLFSDGLGLLHVAFEIDSQIWYSFEAPKWIRKLNVYMSVILHWAKSNRFIFLSYKGQEVSIEFFIIL